MSVSEYTRFMNNWINYGDSYGNYPSTYVDPDSKESKDKPKPKKAK